MDPEQRDDGTKPIAVLKSVGPKLVPFFKTLAIYFVLFGDGSKLESIFYCAIKCLPIISLIIFVLLHGMSFSEYYSYSRKILVGLVFSCFGDAFLVWKSLGYFDHGVAMFAIAQMMYASAFGLTPVNPSAGVACSVLAAMTYSFLFPGLKGSMVYICLIYISLIGFMVWRAIARVQFFNDLWTWTKLCGCAGALCFIVHGTCNNGASTYTCTCEKGYVGTNCETQDFCYSQPCAHGTCNNGASAYTCTCEVGYVGTNCDTLGETCVPNPCQHGGTCVPNSDGSFLRCDCVYPPWFDPYCDTEYGDMRRR